MQVPVFNINGEKVRDIEVNDTVFGVPFNEPLVHQVRDMLCPILIL